MGSSQIQGYVALIYPAVIRVVIEPRMDLSGIDRDELSGTAGAG
jgi:hypothetical protein